MLEPKLVIKEDKRDQGFGEVTIDISGLEINFLPNFLFEKQILHDLALELFTKQIKKDYGNKTPKITEKKFIDVFNDRKLYADSSIEVRVTYVIEKPKDFSSE